jgi:CRP/FNR family transcriptional regulator, cyclic AMP receptor protein
MMRSCRGLELAAAAFMSPPSLAADRPDLNSVPLGDALRQLAERSEIRRFAQGRVLIQEGETGSTLYIILSGRLRAYSTTDDESRRIVYGEYLPGEFLGEMGLDGGPRSASVETVETSWCAVVTRATLEQFVAEHPSFAFELIAKVIRRARAATLSLRAIALNDVYGRIAWLLNTRAVVQPDGSRCAGPLTHQQIADSLGCTRPMVSRVMKELQIGGYITVRQRTIELRRPLPERF